MSNLINVERCFIDTGKAREKKFAILSDLIDKGSQVGDLSDGKAR